MDRSSVSSTTEQACAADTGVCRKSSTFDVFDGSTGAENAAAVQDMFRSMTALHSYHITADLWRYSKPRLHQDTSHKIADYKKF